MLLRSVGLRNEILRFGFLSTERSSLENPLGAMASVPASTFAQTPCRTKRSVPLAKGDKFFLPPCEAHTGEMKRGSSFFHRTWRPQRGMKNSS